jgi:lysozyme family protein
MTAWERAIAFVLAAEGGYVNDPNDAGGETNFGISKRAYPALDIKALTEADAKGIYFRDYWIPLQCDRMEPALAIAVFDTAVNMGVGRAQRLERVTGNWREYLAQRAHDYVTFEKFPIYGRTWLTRVFACYAVCRKEETNG